MKKIDFFCNLCQEKTDKMYLKALYFDCGQIPQKYILEYNRINDCDKHICFNCIKIIQESESILTKLEKP